MSSLSDVIENITNPEVTTIVEFDTESTIKTGAILLAVLVLVVIAWAIARKMSNPV